MIHHAIHFALTAPLALSCAASIDASAQPALEPIAPAEPAQPPEPPATAEFDHTHGLWNGLLAAHVHGEGLDYGAIQKDDQALRRYVAQLEAITPAELESWTRDQRFAFWINAYNAHTVLKVVDNYPLKSIRKLDKRFGLKTVFEDEFVRMQALHPEGKKDKLSLNDIEHKILRVRFPDARLHAAINCASASCPPLLAEAFVATKLDEQLETAMRAFINDGERNVIDPQAGKLQVSKIFEWFQEDFDRDAGSVREYVARFAPAEKRDFILKARLHHLKYSWDLNDAKPKAAGTAGSGN